MKYSYFAKRTVEIFDENAHSESAFLTHVLVVALSYTDELQRITTQHAARFHYYI